MGESDRKKITEKATNRSYWDNNKTYECSDKRDKSLSSLQIVFHSTCRPGNLTKTGRFFYRCPIMESVFIIFMETQTNCRWKCGNTFTFGLFPFTKNFIFPSRPQNICIFYAKNKWMAENESVPYEKIIYKGNRYFHICIWLPYSRGRRKIEKNWNHFFEIYFIFNA